MKHLVFVLLLLTWQTLLAEEEREVYDSGEIKSLSTIKDGQLVAQKKYSLTGKVIYELSYDEDNNKLEIQRSYYDDGQLLKVRPLKNDLIDGLEKEYYQNGKLRAQRTYIDGKKQGKAQGYYESGSIQGDWEFEDGEPVAAKIYYMTGTVHLDHKFENGRKNGLTLEYNKKGKLMAKRWYENDKMIKRKRVR